MKKVFLVLTGAFLYFYFSLFGQTTDVKRLYKEKRYTSLLELLNTNKTGLTATEKKVYLAIVLNAFNRPEESNRLIHQLIRDNKLKTGDSLTFDLLKTEYDNYLKSDRYSQAFEKGKFLLTQYDNYFQTEALSGEEHSMKIWKCLRDEPVQTIVKNGDTRIPILRDIAGLWNVSVTENDQVYPFIFDTGAGISVITDTYAKKFRLKELPESDLVVKAGLTGIGVNARVGICPKLSLGNLEADNVVFLIFPDSTLSFEGGYKINAILGFPFIKGLEEFSIEGEELIIPQKALTQNMKPNMSLDGLSPIIYLTYQEEELPFTFDTGASASTFSDFFYDRFKKYFDPQGKTSRITLGSAGGNKEFKAINVSGLRFKTYNKWITVDTATISMEPFGTDERFYYGNIGQDIINKFNKMTINFKIPCILFE